jgi:hypothetical protein
MLRTPSALLVAGAAAILLLGACSTYRSRSEEKAAVFNSLDTETRERLKARVIHVGDREDMVYIALGRPDEKRETLDATGRSTTWVYNAYWQEYQGTHLSGYRRHVSYDAATKSYRVVDIPDYQPVYQSRSEERVRITFQNGRVTVVEQASRD